MDEFVDYVTEISGPIGKSFGITDPAERDAFRAKVVGEGGDVHKWAQFLNQRLAGKTYAVGEKLSFADVVLFTSVPAVGHCRDPERLGRRVKNLVAHHAWVAALPKMAAHYANAEGLWAVFKQQGGCGCPLFFLYFPNSCFL